MTETIDYGDPMPLEFAVRIKGEDYVLKEASGDAAVVYRNACMRAARFNDGKLEKVEGAADAEPLLVSKCLFKKNPEGSLSNVPLATVKSWKQKIQADLFNRIKEISQLDDEKENEEILQKQIDKLTQKLEKLKGNDPKASPEDCPTGSG